MVEPNEVAKIYAVLALLVTTTGMVSTVMYKGLYGRTLDTYPSAFLLLSASFYFLSAVISLFLYTQRHRLYDVKAKIVPIDETEKDSTKL